jgi:hypothetical protein
MAGDLRTTLSFAFRLQGQHNCMHPDPQAGPCPYTNERRLCSAQCRPPTRESLVRCHFPPMDAHVAATSGLTIDCSSQHHGLPQGLLARRGLQARQVRTAQVPDHAAPAASDLPTQAIRCTRQAATAHQPKVRLFLLLLRCGTRITDRRPRCV